MSKKILFIGNSNSIHIKRWVDYFVECKYETAIATFACNNITNCTKVFYLTSRKAKASDNYFYLLYVYKLSNILKEFKPHYINAHFSYSMGLITLLALKLSSIKAIVSVVCHGSDILAMPHPRIYKPVNKYVLRNANKIFAVSSQIAETIQEWGIRSDKILIGQYGIKEEIVSKDYELKDIDIISNRTYHSLARIDELLEVLNHDFFVSKNIVFILPLITEERLHLFKEKYPFINFLKEIPFNQMISYMKRSKIYISATKSDGTSLSLLEAFASGCYPICSNIASNREWIVDYINGRLFSSFSELRQILMDVLSKNTNYADIINLNNNLILKRSLYNMQMKKIESFLISSTSGTD